jgi:uncharacterized membrane protein YcaP (DUF421 family)
MTEFLNQVNEFLLPLLGLGEETKSLDMMQVSLRALVVFAAAIAIVRVADKRFLARKTAFDVVLALILASLLARAINGSAPLGPTLVSGLVLVMAHRFLAWLSRRSHWFGKLVKGNDDVVIEHGEVREEVLKRHNFTERDLMEDLRLEGVRSPEEVESARIERSGDLSVIKKQKEN